LRSNLFTGNFAGDIALFRKALPVIAGDERYMRRKAQVPDW
jgi:hypothetical protein